MLGKLKSLFQSKKEDAAAAYMRGLEEGFKRAQEKSGKVPAEPVTTASPTPTAESKPRLAKADLSKAKKLRLKYLEEIENQVRTFSGGVRGASIVKMSNGEVKLYKVESKEEALKLIQKARDGKLNIIM